MGYIYPRSLSAVTKATKGPGGSPVESDSRLGALDGRPRLELGAWF